jgi:hypothetical protein
MGTKQTRLVLITLLTGLLLVSTATPARAQLGVAAGLNFESAGDIDTNTNTQQNTTLDNSTGYHVGLVYDLGLGPLNVRPGFFYRKVGQTYEFPSSIEEANAEVSAWEVPVDLRFTVLSTPIISPYVLAGPKASFVRSDLDEIDDELEDISYSIAIGLGAEISLGSALTLQPELRYDYGATSYIDETIEVGNVEFTQEDPKLSAFALRLNVLF